MLAVNRTVKIKIRRCFNTVLAVAIFTVLSGGQLFAQFGDGGGVFLGGGRAIGGIKIDADGVLNNGTAKLTADIEAKLKQGLSGLSADIKQSGLRMISLKALENKMADCKNAGTPFPAEVRYMAGLQRIEYVILSKETGDVIIAGPGEGFKTTADGRVVGETSGMPVIQLEDFLVAMRYVNNARQGAGITVSIDPTVEGIQNVQRLMKNFTPSSFNKTSARQLEEACGPQNITLTGIPKTSRFSQVLVAADYKMKRLAMGLEPAPEFLPSVLAMAKARNSRFKRMAPRFWMEANYEPVGVNDSKTVWKLNGQGVCTKTEEEFLQADGTKKIKPNKLAKKWADEMTENYEKLSGGAPVFRDLRNLMDMSVAAAIIEGEGLLDAAGLGIASIKGLDKVSLPVWNTPKTVPSQCSYARLTRSLIVTTSGGVAINSWSIAKNSKPDSSLKLDLTGAGGQSWWWNVN